MWIQNNVLGSNWGSEYFFKEKAITPPLFEVKSSFPIKLLEKLSENSILCNEHLNDI